MRAFTLSVIFLSPLGLAHAVCPDFSLGEVEADCLWAEVARNFENESTLREELPDLVRQIETDATNEIYKSLWGYSINYDEGAKDLIVSPSILKSLYGVMKIASPKDLETAPQTALQHAGLEHTYGYLFSVLKTSFGYKRARWVSGDIERGLGFTQGMLSPHCTEGTLFSNLTYVFGRIAFRGEEGRIKELEDGASNVAPFLRQMDYSNLNVDRLEESVKLEDGAEVVLRTDILKFVHDSHSSNAALLIYSVLDSREKGSKLISAFPVAAEFSRGLFRENRLGDNQQITTRYNAYVDGWTPNAIVGKRLKIGNACN